jgi:hypothetical protein
LIWHYGQKVYFRFTGSPEHRFTAIKYVTCVLEIGFKDRWLRNRPGDICFKHKEKQHLIAHAETLLAVHIANNPHLSTRSCTARCIFSAVNNTANIDIISDDLIDDPVWFVKHFPEFEDAYAF